VANAKRVLPAGLLAALEAANASEEASSRRLDQLEQRSFLTHLLRLRQACCHPQVHIPKPILIPLSFKIVTIQRSS